MKVRVNQRATLQGKGTTESKEANSVVALVPAKVSFPIVGLGASAGGLEALEQFLAQVPPGSGMGFVVVQHLDPTRKPMMPELLQHATSMKVTQIGDGTRVQPQPDHVYVIPPNKDLSIKQGILRLVPTTGRRGLRLPIDCFFQALALDQRELAVGVILSGMGSDGTRGLEAIKKLAGLGAAQDPATARFDSMPQSVIDADLAEIVTSAADLPRQSLRRLRGVPLTTVSDTDPGILASTALEQVLELLRIHSGNDFSCYKRNSINRRIERRILIHRSPSLSAYRVYLQENSQELGLLFKELLPPGPCSPMIEADVLYICGSTGKYLEPAAGKANWNLFVMAREGLRYELMRGFQDALRHPTAVVLHGLTVAGEGGVQGVTATVRRLTEPEPLRGLVIIVFKDERAPIADRPRKQNVPGSRMAKLEAELQQIRGEAETTRDAAQTAHEELRTANELQRKVDELSRTGDDLKNLLDSTEITTLFLDEKLKVRRFTRFTPRTTRIIRLLPGDTGRPITDLTSELLYPELAADARTVLRTLIVYEKPIRAWNGRWFTVRIMPYRTRDDRVDGLVITFADITTSKTLEAELRRQRTRLERVDAAPEAKRSKVKIRKTGRPPTVRTR